MDSIDSEITRVVNLIFVLDSTENISDDDYAKACKFLNECKDAMIIDGMETEVRVYVASTSGEITDAMYDEVKQFAAFIKQREAEKKE